MRGVRGSWPRVWRIVAILVLVLGIVAPATASWLAVGSPPALAAKHQRGSHHDRARPQSRHPWRQPWVCDFAKTPTQWTVRRTCTTTTTITVPPGVTLEGAGHTITLGGSNVKYIDPAPPEFPQAGYHSGILVGDGGVVRNLEIAPATTCDFHTNLVAIQFYFASGSVDGVNIQVPAGADARCPNGVRVVGKIFLPRNPQRGEFTVNLDHVTFVSHRESGVDTDFFPTGIVYLGDVTGRITDSTVRGVAIGFAAGRGAAPTIEHATFDQVADGVAFAQDPDQYVAPMNLRDSTLIGTGEAVDLLSITGVQINGYGDISGNTIAGFDCGILSGPLATLGNNTFPDPPGNREDLCQYQEEPEEPDA